MSSCPEKDRRRHLPRYSLWTLMVLITAVSAVLAFLKLLGFALLDILVRFAIVTYVTAFLAAPFLIFTAICLSNRLSFRHLPIIGTASADALLALPCFVAVCDLTRLPNPDELLPLVLSFLGGLLLVGIWWAAQNRLHLFGVSPPSASTAENAAAANCIPQQSQDSSRFR